MENLHAFAVFALNMTAVAFTSLRGLFGYSLCLVIAFVDTHTVSPNSSTALALSLLPPPSLLPLVSPLNMGGHKTQKIKRYGRKASRRK